MSNWIKWTKIKKILSGKHKNIKNKKHKKLECVQADQHVGCTQDGWITNVNNFI